MNWYVVQTYSGYENRVKRFLEERINNSDLRISFGDTPQILVPSEEVPILHGERRRQVERKFFPGCLFVKMDMNNESWHLVRSTPWVMGFIGGTAEKPIPVKEEEIAAIERRLEGRTEQHLFETGEVVRIIDGPFSGFSGTVEEVDGEKERLQVAVSIFGRSTPMEIEFNKVEKG